MQELLDEWTKRATRAKCGESLGTEQARISNEVRILEELEAAGCAQIPGEPFDVQFMIEDRYRLLEETCRSVS